MKITRLYNCTAWIKENGNRIILQSYSTKVAQIVKEGDGHIISIYRYPSTTTAQHLRKFQKWLYDNIDFEIYCNYKFLLDVAAKYKKRLAVYAINKNDADYILYDYSYNQYINIFSY